MADVFQGRTRIMMAFVNLLLLALPPPTSQDRLDSLIAQLRKFESIVWAGSEKQLEERHKNMLEILEEEQRRGVIGVESTGTND